MLVKIMTYYDCVLVLQGNSTFGFSVKCSNGYWIGSGLMSMSVLLQQMNWLNVVSDVLGPCRLCVISVVPIGHGNLSAMAPTASTMKVAPYSAVEYKRLRKTLLMRAHRGQRAAKSMLEEVDKTPGKSSKLTLLKQYVTVRKQGRSVATGREPWAPSVGRQVKQLDKRVLGESLRNCVVKGFTAGTVGLERNLAFYGWLRAQCFEHLAPVAQLLSVVEVPEAEEAKEQGVRKKPAGAGESIRKKPAGGGTGTKNNLLKRTKTVLKRTVMGKKEAIPTNDIPGTMQLWFEYVGQDCEQAEYDDARCGLFRYVYL